MNQPHSASRILGVLGIFGALLVGCGDESEPASTDRSGTEQATEPVEPDIDRALAAIDRAVDVPVSLPSIPQGTFLNGKPIIDRKKAAAQLSLLFPNDAVLTIQYGSATFDGCELRDLREVEVNDQPGLMVGGKAQLAPKTLIWPARKGELVAAFGLSGSFSEDDMVQYAESMDSTDVVAAGRKTC